MKKFNLLALLVAVVLVFTACGQNGEQKVEESTNVEEKKVEKTPATEEVKEEDGSEEAEKSSDAESSVEETLKQIQEKGKLVLGTSADYPPYEFTALIDGKDEIVGFDIQLAKYIAQELQVDLEIVDMPFESLLIGLEVGKFDMVIAGMNPDPEREANFSKIYYNATHGVITTKEKAEEIKTIDDLKGKHLGAQIGTVQEGIGEKLEEVELKTLPLITNLILELSTGKIDGVIMEKPVAESYAKVNEDLVVVEGIEWGDESEGTAVALKKGNDGLTEIVNDIIEKALKEDLIDKWIIEANEINEKYNQ